MLSGCLTVSNSPVRSMFDVKQLGSPRAKHFWRLLRFVWQCEGAVVSLGGLHMSTYTLARLASYMAHIQVGYNTTA
jgi:hypothetical protein